MEHCDLAELELEHAQRPKLRGRGHSEPEAARKAAYLIENAGSTRRYGLPDPDDEHVVAPAVVAGAGALVTHNLKDFPSGITSVTGIQVLPPQEFAENAVATNPLLANIAVLKGRGLPEMRCWTACRRATGWARRSR